MDINVLLAGCRSTDRSATRVILNGLMCLTAVLVFAACNKNPDQGGQTTGAVKSDTSCLSEIACVADPDCPNGSHCNKAINPPMCQRLYCGKGGSSCSEDALCKSQKCDDGACRIDCGKGKVFELGQCVDIKEIEWVRIPGGSFQMGSDATSYEEPVHTVNVQPFEMAKMEVTVAQYQKCVEAGACSKPDTEDGCNWGVSGRLNHPINCVDWDQANAYAKWVGGRLPTEAEWEYAARSGGKDRTYPWGNQSATCQNTVMDEGGLGCGKSSTWPVCSKTAGNTEQGLCDMAGNVSEWVQDWNHDSYNGAPSNGSAWESPQGSSRVTRGGSWTCDASYVRAASRIYGTPAIRHVGLGLRPARVR